MSIPGYVSNFIKKKKESWLNGNLNNFDHVEEKPYQLLYESDQLQYESDQL